jgi:hypothetical protein
MFILSVDSMKPYHELNIEFIVVILIDIDIVDI